MKKLFIVMALLWSCSVWAGDIDEITFTSDGTPFQVFGNVIVLDNSHHREGMLNLKCKASDGLYRSSDRDNFVLSRTNKTATPRVWINEPNPPLTGDITCRLAIFSKSRSITHNQPRLFVWPPRP